MALFEQISEDIKKAMLARNKVELEALRGIKKELLEAKTSKENAGELTVAVKAIIEQVGATSPKDMGKVMGVASKQLAGKAEGRAISDKVKEILNSL